MADDSGYNLDDSGSMESSSSASGPRKSGKKSSNVRDAIKKAGQQLNERSVDDLQDQARDDVSRITSYKRGGTKRGSGPARLHKDERIMPKRGRKRRMGRGGGRG
jgi:hypothetical protein